MSDEFHSDLRKSFGITVPFTLEFIEIATEIEPVIIEFFERIAASGRNLRVQRIWLDGGKLRISITDSRPGLDDIIFAAEEAAANILGGTDV